MKKNWKLFDFGHFVGDISGIGLGPFAPGYQAVGPNC